MQMHASSFTHNFLLLFSGPLIWAVHFVTVYGFIGILCARPPVKGAWLGFGVAAWGVTAASLLAIAAMAAVYLLVKPRDMAPDNQTFIRWMSLALSLLSAIAIIWEALAVFLVPVCG
jgi:hypothetical protein